MVSNPCRSLAVVVACCHITDPLRALVVVGYWLFNVGLLLLLLLLLLVVVVASIPHRSLAVVVGC